MQLANKTQPKCSCSSCSFMQTQHVRRSDLQCWIGGHKLALCRARHLIREERGIAWQKQIVIVRIGSMVLLLLLTKRHCWAKDGQ